MSRHRRRVGTASTAVLLVLAMVLTWLATRAEGEVVRRADLNDGGIWVTNAAQARFGRMNKPAGQLDAAVAASTPADTGLDVLQDGAAVVGLARATNQLVPVNVRTGTLLESAALTLPSPGADGDGDGQPPTTADLRGGTLAVVEPLTGKVRAQRVDTAAGITTLDRLQAAAKPLATVGADATVAVGLDGTVYAVSAAAGVLAVLVPDGAGGFEQPRLVELGFTAKGVQVSALGDRWVVLDPSAGTIRAAGLGSPLQVREALAGDTGGPGGARAGGAAYALLQHPGPADEVLLVATGSGLVPISLAGRDDPPGRVTLPAGAAGTRLSLAPPVRLGACAHATWAAADRIYYGRTCADQGSAQAVTLEVPPRGTRTDGVRLRVNRGLVVLNDLDGGGLWDLDSPKPVRIDDWTSVIPPPQAGTSNVKPDPNLSDDQQVRRPPEANPDELSVRPGRTSTLHVLDNDTDSQGAVLAIAPGDVSTPDVAGIQVSPSVDGQTISVSVPDTPAARVVRFTYGVNNGSAGPEGRATALVVLQIVDDSVNTPPHLRAGQTNLAKAVSPVVRGGHVAVQVVADWRDDENDPLVLDALDPAASVDASGALAVTAPDRPGGLDLRYRVEDGRGGSAEAKATVQVLGDTDRPVAPVAQADVVRAVQGKPVQLQPLGNDLPGADPTDPQARMRLAADVRGPGQLRLDTNLETGVVTVTGSTPGSYLLTYAAQVGAAVGAGRFRVDILAPPTGDAPPVAAPDAATLRDQAPTVTDVLANDYSPRSDVLVIQSVASTETWLRAWVVQGRWLRVTATAPLASGTSERRGVLAYTISDGTRSATGELSVVQKPPPPSAVLPTVVDDQAVVRSGDVVTIAALDNDSMADGVPLKITPEAVKVVSGGGQVYPSGTVLRYLPDPAPITTAQVAVLEYAAYPDGMPERSVTGRVTVTVTPPPTPQTPDQPPTARNFSASVTAGDALTITVPTSGIDPDGDLVYVSGIVGEDGGPVNLQLGRVTAYGASTIRYEAYPMSAGTEVIRYAVTDRYGKSGEGLIRVGVVPPGAPQPPVAVPDDIVAAPGRVLTVDPLANDLVPKNADVVLEDPAAVNDAAAASSFARQGDNTFRVTAPDEGPAKVLVYGVDGGLFDPSRAPITVRGRRGYDNPPVAVDDTARVAPATPSAAPSGGADGPGPSPAAVTAVVDVLANDHDVDGERSALRIVQVGDGATVEDAQVRVVLLDHPRAVPYVLEDADGAKAMALVYVPANGSDVPYVLAGKPVTMDRDATRTVRLGEHVADPRGRTVRVTTADSVSTSPSQHLAATVTGPGELVLTAAGGYVGPAALMLEVTDATGPDDPAPRTAYLVVPVQIGPLVPLLRCPDWEVNVVADRPPRVVDVPRLCSAWFPEGLDPATVEYAAQWDQPAAGVGLAQRGEGGRQVVLTASADALHGARGVLTVGVAGASQRYPLRVRVTSLRTDPAAAGGPDAPPPPPAAVVRPARVEGLIAGQSQVVNLAQYLDSPFGTLHCAVAAVHVASGTGVTGSATGCVLTVSASPDAQGATVLTVEVSDAPDRVSPGTVTVTVLSKPGPPQGVTAAADRVQGGSARVAWLPPAYDGGLPVLEYQVSTAGQSVSCPASPCTVTGLTNGVDYTFTVRARNAAGWSDAGGPSEAVRPDTAPGPVSIGEISPGDRTLAVAWSPPTNLGSAVDLYNVQAVSLTAGPGGGVFPVPAGSLATTISGLVNDDQYTLRVQAHNEAGWGPYGPARTAQSIGVPATVPAPTLSYPRPTPNDPALAVSISWPAVDPNGPPLVSYTVWTQVDGGSWSVLTTVSATASRVAASSVPLDGRVVGYAVTATNGGGLTSARGEVATFTAVGVPEIPRPPSVTTPRPDKTMDVSLSLGGSHARAWTSVNYRTTAGVSGSLPCGGADCAKSVTLANGTIATQTMSIQGCTDAGTCSDWSAPSNVFQPYGPTKPVAAGAPSVSGSRGKYTVTFRWDVVENGRPVTVSVTGAPCALARDQASCTVSGVGYDTTVSVAVTASSVAGTTSGVPMSVRTPSKVPITLAIAPSTTTITCTGGKPCYAIVVTTTQWDAPSAACTFSSPAGPIGTATVPTNTTTNTGIGYAGTATVTATCRNAATGESATDTATWKLPP